jgi:hypothetical protein
VAVAVVDAVVLVVMPVVTVFVGTVVAQVSQHYRSASPNFALRI